MTDTAVLSSDTMELMETAVRESEQLSEGDSLDKVFRHFARAYIISNKYGGDELAGEVAEYADTEAEARQKEIKDKITSGK